MYKYTRMNERVYKTAVRDTSDLKQHLIDTWGKRITKHIIDEPVDQWRKRFRAREKAKGTSAKFKPQQ